MDVIAKWSCSFRHATRKTGPKIHNREEGSKDFMRPGRLI